MENKNKIFSVSLHSLVIPFILLPLLLYGVAYLLFSYLAWEFLDPMFIFDNIGRRILVLIVLVLSVLVYAGVRGDEEKKSDQ